MTGGAGQRSPEQRESLEERAARIKAQAMRDHPFVGQGPYCEAWSKPVSSGGPETGTLTMRSGCGYPPDLHPGGADDRSPDLGEPFGPEKPRSMCRPLGCACAGGLGYCDGMP